MNDIPKIVFSKTLQRGDWPEASPAAIYANRSGVSSANRERDLIAYGGSTFDRALPPLGFVDEYRLMIQPAALGPGSRCSRI